MRADPYEWFDPEVGRDPIPRLTIDHLYLAMEVGRLSWPAPQMRANLKRLTGADRVRDVPVDRIPLALVFLGKVR